MNTFPALVRNHAHGTTAQSYFAGRVTEKYGVSYCQHKQPQDDCSAYPGTNVTVRSYAVHVGRVNSRGLQKKNLFQNGSDHRYLTSRNGIGNGSRDAIRTHLGKRLDPRW